MTFVDIWALCGNTVKIKREKDVFFSSLSIGFQWQKVKNCSFRNLREKFTQFQSFFRVCCTKSWKCFNCNSSLTHIRKETKLQQCKLKENLINLSISVLNLNLIQGKLSIKKVVLHIKYVKHFPLKTNVNPFYLTYGEEQSSLLLKNA